MSVVAGIGVWTTHFIAMLGYRPDIALGYDPGFTLASALVGIALIGGPLAATVLVRRRWQKILLGAAAGAGVGAMHFTGMSALQGCAITYNSAATSVAFLVGMLAFGGAMAIRRNRRLLGGTLIVLGVCSLHFTALTGTTLDYVPQTGLWTVDPVMLSAFVALASLMLCATAFVAAAAGARIDDQIRAAARAAEFQFSVLSTALHNMTNGLVMVGPDGLISLHNDRARELLRLESNEIAIGMPLAVYVGNIGRRNGWDEAKTRKVLAKRLEIIAKSEVSRIEQQYADGKVLSIACQPMPGGGAILTYDDLTEQKVAKAKIEHMAYHDALTGLPNRRGFLEQVQQMLDEQEQVILLMLDLDRFKAVNDTLGHPVGDALLIEVAARLRERCRISDLIFRLGGDEFAILPHQTSEEETEDLAWRLIAAFGQSFVIDGHRISIGCSVGQAMSVAGEEHQQLVQKADLALYRAKSLGRNRVERYEGGMIEKARERRQTELDLARALRENEFELYYQPLCSLPDSRLAGFEALIRWNHPTRGRVSPVEFIPLAEENGMICDIGSWVLEEACRQVALWPAHLHVSVNVSPVQMRSGTMIASGKGGARKARHCAVAPGAGADRDRDGHGRPADRGDVARTAQVGRAHCHGRLRDGVLVVGASARLRTGPHQDRPELRRHVGR